MARKLKKDVILTERTHQSIANKGLGFFRGQKRTGSWVQTNPNQSPKSGQKPDYCATLNPNRGTMDRTAKESP
jgi:hypothetical protein